MLLLKTCLSITPGKKIKKQYKNNKLKTIAPTRKGEFDLPGGSYSVSYIQDYIKYIKKNISNNPPVHIYINKINNRLVFKVKDGYKLELQTHDA